MDDTFTVLHEYDVEEFTEHKNRIDPHIKPEKDSKLPLMDLCTHIGLGKDFSLKLTILLRDLHIEVLTFVEYN